MTTVLSATSADLGASLTDLAYQAVMENYQTQADEKLAAVIEPYEQSYEATLEEVQSLASVKGETKSVSNTLQNNLDNIDEIQDLLFDLKVAVETAATTTDIDYISNMFDELLSEIDSTANSLPAGFTLTGNTGQQNIWDDPEISYTYDTVGTSSTITGEFIGNDFYITDEDGNTWVPDWGSMTLNKYSDYGSSTDQELLESVSFADGVELVSRDGDEITFSIYPEREDLTETVSGTLSVGGTGILPSWMYDLSTEEGRAEAADDIASARVTAQSLETTLTLEKISVDDRTEKLQLEVDDLSDEAVEQLREGYTVQAELQEQLTLQYQAILSNLNTIASMQSNYAQLFSGALDSSNKLSGYLIDQTA